MEYISANGLHITPEQSHLFFLPGRYSLSSVRCTSSISDMISACFAMTVWWFLVLWQNKCGNQRSQTRETDSTLSETLHHWNGWAYRENAQAHVPAKYHPAEAWFHWGLYIFRSSAWPNVCVPRTALITSRCFLWTHLHLILHLKCFYLRCKVPLLNMYICKSVNFIPRTIQVASAHRCRFQIEQMFVSWPSAYTSYLIWFYWVMSQDESRIILWLNKECKESFAEIAMMFDGR